MHPSEILLSTKFNKSLPEGRREHTLRKLKHFFTVYTESKNKAIHTSARPMEIRGVPGVYKLRTSRGERVLYEVDQESHIILREYSSHDEQISRAKNMSKNESGDIAFDSLFNATSDENDYDRYEIEPASDSPLVMDQTEIIIATDEWIAQCENTEDYIWLASAEQAEIINSDRYPQFISGSAGTGKTTVLFQKLCGLAQNKSEILYITIAATLKEEFQRIYEKFKPKQESAKITFLTIDELYGILMPNHKPAATQEQFLSEFSSMCQKLNINSQDAWCEIEGLVKSHLGITNNATISFLDQLLNSASTTLSSKNYGNVKTKYSYFAVEQRHKIHEIAVRYDKWLAGQNLMDINQLAAQIIKSDPKRKYDLIMIDEVQDFTELQLYMIMKLTKSPTRVIFSGDINQNVRPTFFMFERLYNIYYSLGCKNAKDNMFTLTKNYRSCKEIVLLLNRILNEQGQRIGYQGSKEDEGIYETGFRDGHNPQLLETTDENVYKILSAIFDKHYAIAVTPDDMTRDMLAAAFPEAESRIFTVQEAKGLEYNVVFTINVTSAYKKEWRKILTDKNVKRQRRFRRFFGYIYVAASRARNHLVISEEKGCPFLELVDGTYEPLGEWDLARVGLAAQSTADDFEKDARKLEKAGLTDKAQSAREIARKMRETEEPELDAETEISTSETASASSQKPLVYLTKRLILMEDSSKKGVRDDQGNIVIACRFDSVCHSSYKDKNGKSVFECRLNDKVTYFDQNGDVFKPVIFKVREQKKKNRKVIIAIAAALIMSFAFFAVMLITNSKQPEEPLVETDKATDIEAHEPIMDVIAGRIIQVSAGHTHSAALMEDGTVWVWGDNLYDGNTAAYTEFQGRYAINTTFRTETNQPKIKKIDIDNVVYIAAGNYITAAIKNDGSLWTWGYNVYGALGNGIDFTDPPDIEHKIDSTPYKILDDVESVSLGDGWGMAVKKDGTLWTWGKNTAGVLCNGEFTGGQSCTPNKTMDNVSAASAGENHGLALKKDGTVWVWGSNENGQLGNADNKVDSSSKPLKVLDDAVQISAGYLHSSAIKKDGTVWTWGGVTDGRASKPTQYPIKTSENIVETNGGNNWPLFLADDGKLYTWDAGNKRLHDIMDSVIQVSMFSNHYLVLKDDGSVWAFGSNKFSQLGDGTLEKRDEPIMIYEDQSQS